MKKEENLESEIIKTSEEEFNKWFIDGKIALAQAESIAKIYTIDPEKYIPRKKEYNK